MLSLALILASTVLQSYFFSQYSLNCDTVAGGTPYDQVSFSGNSKPVGSLAVATRWLMNESRSSGTAILKGFGSSILGVGVGVGVGSSRKTSIYSMCRMGREEVAIKQKAKI